jgi:hypothetical protein
VFTALRFLGLFFRSVSTPQRSIGFFGVCFFFFFFRRSFCAETSLHGWSEALVSWVVLMRPFLLWWSVAVVAYQYRRGSVRSSWSNGIILSPIVVVPIVARNFFGLPASVCLAGTPETSRCPDAHYTRKFFW